MLYGTDDYSIGQVLTPHREVGGFAVLDAAYRVLCGSMFDRQCPVGGDFCSLFDVPPAEMGEIERYLRDNNDDALLIQGREMPLLIRRAPGMLGHVLVLVPPPEIYPVLAAPMLYMEQKPAHLRLSAASAIGRGTVREELLLPFSRWISRVEESFSPIVAPESLADLLRSLQRRIANLAKWAGICLHYDLNGIGATPLPDLSFDILTAWLIPIFSLVHRCAEEKTAWLLPDREGPDALVVHMAFSLRCAEDEMTELTGFEEKAGMSGNFFLVSRSTDDPAFVHLRFSAARKELSLQEMRNFFSLERYWEKSCPFPLSFSEDITS